ncbi:MAG: tRNA (adenosine(37)-N6)-threonylcarbamoyltransferase complex dimerization subunit type 1 TsaB [bacterium]|nr:tRNA (adenosine(37)-N6)-threonylcarbamoyltransferase complex dimerization subunit type 1 TsaB [bacterium]
MIRVAAVDTSTWWAGCALVERESPDSDPQTVAEVGFLVRDSHSRHVLDALDGLLARCDWSRTSMDAFVAVRGPGAFTGIRVGLGTVRGLCLATERPGVGVLSLDALAEAHGADAREVLAIVDAGRDDVYGCRYAASASPATPVGEPWLDSIESEARFATPDARIVYPPGSERAAARVARLWPGIERAPAAQRATASAAARLALLRGLEETGDEGSLTPTYLRLPDAELKAKRRG